jgi:hypothetical protein
MDKRLSPAMHHTRVPGWSKRPLSGMGSDSLTSGPRWVGAGKWGTGASTSFHAEPEARSIREI